MNSCYCKILIFLFLEMNRKKLRMSYKRTNKNTISQNKLIKKELSKQRISLEIISITLKRLKDQISITKLMIFNPINLKIGINRIVLIKELAIVSLQLSNKMKEKSIKNKWLNPFNNYNMKIQMKALMIQILG